MIIKFMTFNIQHCKDYVKKVIDIDLMANTIKKCGVEIIGLNEVYGGSSNNLCQAEEIAKRLGYYHYFGKSIDYQGIPYGNAIISKYKIKDIETIKIPDPVRNTNELYESRTIIKASFENPSFTVLVSHFGLAKSEQVNAVTTVVDLISNINTPIILMGDFNMEASDPKLAPIYSLLEDTLKDTLLLSYPSINPTRKIDYIFVSSDIEIIDANIPNLVASDHLPHSAILNIK